jgi:hypothetical protein
MTNSITCPVCNNLCSALAVSCPKCGHPFNHGNETTANLSNSQPFIIIFRIIAYISLAIGGWYGFLLIVGTIKNFLSGYLDDWLNERGYSFILPFIVSMLSYAIFSFLISNAKKK